MQLDLDFRKPREIEQCEIYCLEWLFPDSYWRSHLQWWESRSLQERELWVFRSNIAMQRNKTAVVYMAGIERRTNEARSLAVSWARDIREAAKRGEPVPIRPAPKYEAIFDWACELAGVLVAPVGQA